MAVTDADRAYLAIAVEQARRGRGSVAPNPMVGAVVVRAGAVIALGYHAAAGELHAEAMALDGVADARGATIYVTLEPCAHIGRQPACAAMLVRRGVDRVVVGTMDPNPRTRGAGVAHLRAAGIVVDIVNDAVCARLIEDFTTWITSGRPYGALKMASSLDGMVVSRPNTRQQLSGDAWSDALRGLRAEHDAVMVGAGTLLIDDPLLTVRPPLARARPYRRIVVAGSRALTPSLRMFATADGYDPTIVLTTPAERKQSASLSNVAEIVETPANERGQVALLPALQMLKERFGIHSILCEGGPTLAAAMVEEGLVDRLYFVYAPVLLSSPTSVGVMGPVGESIQRRMVVVDRCEQFGNDVLISGRMRTGVGEDGQHV